MQMAAFRATCPFEIGDKVMAERVESIEHTPCGWAPHVSRSLATITDIAAVHYVKTGKVVFKYEFDNSGDYVEIEQKAAGKG